MVKITWAKSALSDIQNIYDFIEKDSEKYARRLIEHFFSEVTILQHFPRSGRIVPEFENTNIRELIHGNYRIVYKLSGNTISIVRVHHSARFLR